MAEEMQTSIIDEQVESIAEADGEQAAETAKADDKQESGKHETDKSENGKQESDQNPGDKDWQLDVPEDFPLPEDNLKSFADAAKKLGLTMEQAKGMLDWHKGFHDAVLANGEQIRKQTLEAWQKEMDRDADFGGARFKATVADARKAFAKFDTDGALRKVLRESGYDRHPAIIRVVARVGRAMGEHDFIGGNGEGTNAPLEERLWKQSA